MAIVAIALIVYFVVFVFTQAARRKIEKEVIQKTLAAPSLRLTQQRVEDEPEDDLEAKIRKAAEESEGSNPLRDAFLKAIGGKRKKR